MQCRVAVQLLCKLLPLVDSEAVEAILAPLLDHLPGTVQPQRRKRARRESSPSHPSAVVAEEEREDDKGEEEEGGEEEQEEQWEEEGEEEEQEEQWEEEGEEEEEQEQQRAEEREEEEQEQQRAEEREEEEQEQQREEEREEDEQEEEEQDMAEDPQGAGEGMPQGRVARRSTRRQGEGVGGYTLDTRGLVSAMGGGSQPSSQQVPGRTPHETLHYATGDDLEAFVSMAATLLHCQEGGSSEEIRQLVCQLTDTRVVCESSSPCPPPQSSALANLEAWDCTSHMVHIRSLLQVAHRISLLAQYHIGGFLLQITAGATAQERHGILAAIASAACRQERSRYRSTLAACGCPECTRALCWLDHGEQGPPITPCKAMEVQTRFARDHVANLTPTFFRQCILLHTTMPPTHPLLTASVYRATISPTHIRLLVGELQRVTCRLQRLGSPLPLSLGQLGLWHQFRAATRCEEAVDFVDGDGGYLVARHFPGLLPFVQQRAPNTTWAEGMRGHLIQFRCHAYDAVELAHVYHGGNRAHHLGYQALCAARGAVARASSVIAYTSGDSDVRASRLVCDIIIVDAQGTATSLAETILRAGLAHPMPGAPATYLSAYAEAESAAAGVFSVFPPALAKSQEVRPDRLRAAFATSSHALHFGGEEDAYSVSKRSTLRCASHMVVWESYLQGAGQGLFLRARSPHQASSPFIRANTILCGYGTEPISEQELNQLPEAELEYTLTVRRTLHFNSYR